MGQSPLEEDRGKENKHYLKDKFTLKKKGNEKSGEVSQSTKHFRSFKAKQQFGIIQNDWRRQRPVIKLEKTTENMSENGFIQLTQRVIYTPF